MIKIDITSEKHGNAYLVKGTNQIKGEHNRLVSEVAALLMELDEIDGGSVLQEAIEIHMEVILDDLRKS